MTASRSIFTGPDEKVPDDAPMDVGALQAMLASGNPARIEQAEPELPPMPEPEDMTPAFEQGVTAEEIPTGKTEVETRDMCLLPPKAQQEQLKAKFGELRVIPIPFSMAGEKKLKAFIVRPLSGMAWRKYEETAVKVAEKTPGVPWQEIFQRKVVEAAVVWPQANEQQLLMQRAGLVPTLFGVVQIISWFFDPEALMKATFVL